VSYNPISEVFPDREPIDRVSTNAWEHIKPAVEATGRRVLAGRGGGVGLSLEYLLTKIPTPCVA
jgi:hypothetical protein